MKMLLIASSFLISLPAFSQVQGQFPECGYDYNCYYQKLEESKQKEKQEERAEQDRYRSQQLEYQDRQLEESEEQNELIQRQLEEDAVQDQDIMQEDQYLDPPV